MQKLIKICYILPEYNENTDSHFFHLYEFLEKLSRKVDIFLLVEKSKTKNINLGNIVYIQKFHFLPFRFLESFLVILKARIKGYKIFYTHYCYMGGINAAIISRLTGGKSYYWNCAMNWLFRQKMLQGIGYKLSLKFSHFLVTGSEKMKRGYLEHYNLKLDKIKVMPNWINLERFKPKNTNYKTQTTKTILFVHWLSKRKGADMIVPITKQLLQLQIVNYKLLVVGTGPYREQLLKEIKENKLEDFVKVIGEVPNKDIIKYYQGADLFIMPSMEEGFPRVLLEAMAYGVPYVASDVGAVREISPEIAQRFLVKAGNTEMFVHKIETLLSDKTICEQFRKEELEKIKEYSLENIINKFIETIS